VGEVPRHLHPGSRLARQAPRRIFSSAWHPDEHLLERPGWKTPFYGKVILTGWDTRQEDARLDMVTQTPLAAEDEELLASHCRQAIQGLDALIGPDYIPNGIVPRHIRETLLQLAEQHPQVVCLADSRERSPIFNPG